MNRARREFTISDRIAIVGRATDSSGRVHCSVCGIWCKSRKDYEIDHVIPEGMRSAADKQRKLVAADGRVLCKALCHKTKTQNDVGDIGKAKRLEAAELGVKPPRRKINWGHGEKEPKPRLKVAAGKPRIAREYGQ